MTFFKDLDTAVTKNNSLVCVGLDPDEAQFPSHLKKSAAPIIDFNKAIIEATHDLVCAYKPNIAFYEKAGTAGLEALRKTLEFIPNNIPVILDAKRGDIGNTATAYAAAAFKDWGAGAVTVNPYLGYDSLLPFLEYGDRGIFILCLTSNPGARDFQMVPEKDPLFHRVAKKIVEWNSTKGNCGMVVGATHVSTLEELRAIAPDIPFLVPGVGAQKGDLRGAVRYAKMKNGKGILINASRSILYASRGADFAAKSREAALALRDEINKYR